MENININEIPYDGDELIEYVSLSKHIKEETERNLNYFVNDVTEHGDSYMKELDRKKKYKKVLQEKLIPYILKHRAIQYNEDELMSYSYDDVKKIYDELKHEKRHFFIKFFHFLFNVE
jgi:hypothetical protein